MQKVSDVQYFFGSYIQPEENLHIRAGSWLGLDIVTCIYRTDRPPETPVIQEHGAHTYALKFQDEEFTGYLILSLEPLHTDYDFEYHMSIPVEDIILEYEPLKRDLPEKIANPELTSHAVYSFRLFCWEQLLHYLENHHHSP